MNLLYNFKGQKYRNLGALATNHFYIVLNYFKFLRKQVLENKTPSEF